VAAYEVLRGEAVIARVTGTRADEQGLEPRTRYCYSVRALEPGGLASRPSERVCAATLDGRMPSVPGSLQATILPGNRARLAWQAPRGTVVAGYDVIRGGERVEMVKGTALTDAGLQPTKEYCYTVRSFDAAGNRSGPSSPACLTIPDTAPPSVPAGVVARAPAETEVHLGWAPSTDDVGVARYDVLRVGGTKPLAASEPAAVDRGLAASRRYCYAVRACDASGNCSAPSAEACVTTPDLTPPARPASLTATAAGDRRIDLRWADSTDNVGVAGYEVLRAGKPVARLGAVASHADGGLQPAVEYCYAVRAFDAAGNRSPASAPACATTPDLTPPTIPENPAALPVSSTQVFVAWDPSTDDVGVAGYEVLRGDAVVAKVESTRARATGLQPRKEYCFRVRALDAAGNRSGPTASVCATTSSPAELGAPSDLRVRRLSPTSLFLQWEPSESPGVLYRVYAQGKEVGITGANTFTPSGRLGAEPNCFRIAAMDREGRESPKSNEICARPQVVGSK
jgi:chitodextrinase